MCEVGHWQPLPRESEKGRDLDTTQFGRRPTRPAWTLQSVSQGLAAQRHGLGLVRVWLEIEAVGEGF